MATRILDLVHVSVAEQADAEGMAALEVEAKRDGLKIVKATESAMDTALRDYENVPATVAAGDRRGFLDNLADIAAGRVRVKGRIVD
jgi:hypothetical protein